jgi:F-type H+/Na+-transporting ATPase subunit alpha
MSDSNIFYSDIGVVESIGDGIINILGLQNAANGEMVEIFINSNNESNEIIIQKALILNLGEKWVSAVCLASDDLIKPGQFVALTNEQMSIPVGDSLLGRVVSL